VGHAADVVDGGTMQNDEIAAVPQTPPKATQMKLPSSPVFIAYCSTRLKG